MSTIQEIKKALKSDPRLLERVDGLKEFVNQHRDEFDFLFKDKKNVEDYTGSNCASVTPQVTKEEPGDDVKPLAKKWNPKITQI